MQIKEFEAYTLKECLQQVRDELGPDAVILETRKFRKGGLLGVGARDAVCIVAAVGITVKNDLDARHGEAERQAAVVSAGRGGRGESRGDWGAREAETAVGEWRRGQTVRGQAVAADKSPIRPTTNPGQTAAVAAARNAYAQAASNRQHNRSAVVTEQTDANGPRPYVQRQTPTERLSERVAVEQAAATTHPLIQSAEPTRQGGDANRFALLERAMREIKEGLVALQREQKEGQERTVSAVVSAVGPALSVMAGGVQEMRGKEVPETPFPGLYDRLVHSGISPELAQDLLDSLPDFSAWSEAAREPLAISALRDLMGRRVCCSGPLTLTPGSLKAVALIGPTGVGKTTTIAKLAAHYALVENKRVALLTVDTYRIAAVEQLKTYSQIIDIPISVAYNQSEVLPVIAQYADYDLLLIDTAGRSQKNIMQVGELKSLLEAVKCETHLVLSASMKEQDMLEAARRFAAARVDRLIFSKLDETDSHGTLVNVGAATGIPLSYLTTGQKVPEDLEVASGGKLATLIVE